MEANDLLEARKSALEDDFEDDDDDDDMVGDAAAATAAASAAAAAGAAPKETTGPARPSAAEVRAVLIPELPPQERAASETRDRRRERERRDRKEACDMLSRAHLCFFFL